MFRLGGRAARVGWVGVTAFHLLLALFGGWTLVWVVAALVALTILARRDLRPPRRQA